MRIGFFVWEYPPEIVGGLGTYAKHICEKFVDLGHDVSVFTLNSGTLKTREISRGVEVHRPLVLNASDVFPFLNNDFNSWGSNKKFFSDIFIYNLLSATKFLNDLIQKEKYKFDVVTVHDWLSSISGLIIKNNSKIPVVFHAHSTEWGRSGGNGFEMIKNLENSLAQSAAKIITVSHAMSEDLIKNGWPSSKMRVVWNGVDTEKYNPSRILSQDIFELRKKYDIPKDWNMILFVGRLSWFKGVKNLLKAMPSILKEYPNTKLVIIGKGEEQMDLMNISERLNIKKNVSFNFEFLDDEQRILHYAAADLCVFPSLYEPFGIVSLEAMSMGKPVVVGARGVVGFREQIINSGDNQTGVHVNGADPSDISWGVKATLRNPKKASQWGKNGRKHVLNHFTWDKTAKETLKIYETFQKR